MKLKKQCQFVKDYLDALAIHEFVDTKAFDQMILQRPKLADFADVFNHHFVTTAQLVKYLDQQMNLLLADKNYNWLAKTAQDTATVHDLINNQDLHGTTGINDTYWDLDAVVHHHPNLAAMTNGDLSQWVDQQVAN